MKNTTKHRYGRVSKWYNKAVEADGASEQAGCYNHYIRASRLGNLNHRARTIPVH
jgi:hypothetical protein